MSMRRMLPFVLVNILVSVVVVLGILYWWENRETAVGEETAVTTLSTPTATPELTFEEASSQVAAENDPEPDSNETIHVVQRGDTLGNISRIYDVSIDDIMAANSLTNPNILSVGQQLLIPIGGLPTATPAPSPTPTSDAPPPPIATEPALEGEAQVEIADVIGVGQVTAEAVQIINNGSRQVALQGWKLVGEQGQVYTFGQVTLFGEGAGILVHTAAGQDGATDFYWGQETAVWQPGSTVTLLNADDEIQSTYVIP
ncbi:MAG: lamin tail domain-containing protein [Chloroflexota bacterium]|jgi:LysM repeat protein